MADFSSAAKIGSASIPPQSYDGRSDPEPTESQHLDKVEEAQGQNAFNSERPLNVQPVQSGGVARDGKDNLPMGKAGLVDKVIGKVEKVIGKATHNPDMHEAGELRESGGKEAATGQARAPHD